MSFKRIFTIVLAAIMIVGTVGLLSFADEAEEIAADISWFDSENPQTEYVLDTKEELAGFAKLVNEGNSFSGKTIKLSTDIDMANVNNWTPIGTSTANAFKGTFDGCGNTISNLTITRDAAYGNGFFGNILSGAVIKNISFDNILVRRYDNENCSGNIYGVVTGYTYGSTLFENVTVKNSKVVGYGKVAALIGMSAEPGNHTTSLINCLVENTELKGTYNVAGLVGTVLNNNVITTSTTVKNVTWTPGDAEAAYREFSGNLSDGTAFDGLYWMYRDNAYAGWSNFYNDWYIQYQGDGYLTEGIEADGLCHNAEASISGYAYETLKEATDAAEVLIEEGGESVTIKLLGDVMLSNREAGIEPSKAGIVYDLDGKNLILGGDHVITTDTTFKNGNILITDESVGTGVFWLWNSSNTVTFEDVVFSNANENLNACSIFFAASDSVGVTPVSDCGDFKFKNCEINLKNNTFNPDAGANLFYFQNGTSEVEINGGAIAVSGFARGLQYGTYDIKDAKIKMENMSGNCIRRAEGTIANTELTFDGCENGIKLDNETTLTIEDESVVIIENAVEKVLDIKNGGELIIKSGKYSFDPTDYVIDEFGAIFDEEEQLYIIIPEKVTITFNTNDGSEISPVVVDSNVLVDLASYVPKKSGYTFAGWYADEQLTEEVSEISLLSDKTLYAAWKKKKSSSAGLTGPVLGSKNEQNDVKQIILTIGENTATVFGEKIHSDVAPVIRNERTMLPIRFVAEALGAKVEWNEEKREVLITTDEVTIVVTIDSDIAFVGGKEALLDSPAFIENDRTYLPIRFISENLGTKVEWNEKNMQVTITKQ